MNAFVSRRLINGSNVSNPIIDSKPTKNITQFTYREKKTYQCFTSYDSTHAVRELEFFLTERVIFKNLISFESLKS